MEKLIIVAGSPNSGKTITTNLTIQKLINNGYTVIRTNNGKFWENINLNGEFIGVGVVELTDSIKKIIVITFGDIVDNIVRNFKNIDFDGVDTLICCSHATRGKKVFNHFHNMIGKIDLNVTQVIPIHKNFLCGHNQNLENEKTAELIIKLLEM